MHSYRLLIKKVFFSCYIELSIIFAIFGLVFFMSVASTEFREKFLTESLVSAVSGFIAFIYFVQKQKLEEQVFLNNAFISFNQRYSELFFHLDSIGASQELGTTEQYHLSQYFNLCAEEYLVYKQGYIPEEVWSAWIRGMAIYWQKDSIQKYWLEELKSQSFYGFDPRRHITKKAKNDFVNAPRSAKAA